MHRQNCELCRNLHLCFCAQCRFVISAFGKIFALQICAFCARHIFAHFAELSHLRVLHMFCTVSHIWRNLFVRVLRVCEILFRSMTHAHVKFMFLQQIFREFSVFRKKCRKSRKSRNFRKCPENVPKKAHVFLSGTRVVPGPTRLTTQGGKSRQNMH